MKISKINPIKKVFNSMKQCAQKNCKNKTSITPQASLMPLVMTPLLLYNLKGSRDALLVMYKSRAINEQTKLLNAGKITKSEYNNRIEEIKQYYENSKSLDPNITAQSIQQNEPSFRGDSDYSVYDGSNDDDCCDCDCDSDDDCCDSDSDSGYDDIDVTSSY